MHGSPFTESVPEVEPPRVRKHQDPSGMLVRQRRAPPTRLLLRRHWGSLDETAGLGVMQPSAIGAVTTAVIAAGRGAHELFGDGPRVGRRPVLTMAPPLVAADGVAVTAGGPELGPPYDGRLLTDDRGLAASRLPDGRNRRSVAATLAAPVHRRSSASPRSFLNGIDARTLRRRRRRPRRPPPRPRTDR